jgi:hypothetical protein
MEREVTYMDCPEYKDAQGDVRCGLPAEVEHRYTMDSTNGPIESALIRCPLGHWFSGPVESLRWERPEAGPEAGTEASTEAGTGERRPAAGTAARGDRSAVLVHLPMLY